MSIKKPTAGEVAQCWLRAPEHTMKAVGIGDVPDPPALGARSRLRWCEAGRESVDLYGHQTARVMLGYIKRYGFH